MALRSLAGKLRTLRLRAPGRDALPPKVSHTEPLDPAKFASAKDYIRADLANMEKEIRGDLEELWRLKKAYDRTTLVAHGVSTTAAVFCGWAFVEYIIQDED